MLLMFQVKELVEGAFKAPIASLLVVFGLIFLVIAVIGNNQYIKPGKQGRKMAGIIGGVLVILGVGIHIFSWSASKTEVAEEFIKNRPNSTSQSKVENLGEYQLK